jgi:antitoxin ParD1/3/4
MPTRNINLTGHYNDFVSISINSGRFKNASEVIRAGLRLLEEEESTKQEKLKALKAITEQAFNSMDKGDFSTLSFDQIADKALSKFKNNSK